VLRWLKGNTDRGWSHPAVDPDKCDVWTARFERICYAARERARGERAAAVNLGAQDASAMRGCMATIRATEPTGFELMLTTLDAIASAVAPVAKANQRLRPSPLAR
jgi:hypothetical protein